MVTTTKVMSIILKAEADYGNGDDDDDDDDDDVNDDDGGDPAKI